MPMFLRLELPLDDARGLARMFRGFTPGIILFILKPV